MGKKVLLISLTLILLFSSPVFAETYYVIPERGIEGVVYLGNTKDQITQNWGEPEMILPLEEIFGSSVKGCKGYFYPDYSINLAFDDKDILFYIGTESNKYITKEGIMMGDLFSKVVNIYGEDYFKEREVDENFDYKIVYEKPGYEFKFSNDSLGYIGVMSSNPPWKSGNNTSANQSGTTGNSSGTSFLMVPGYGVENLVYLGNTKDQITGVWGEPAAILPLEAFFGPIAKDWKAYIYPERSLNLAFNEYDKIFYIVTESDIYATPGGIKVGDSVNKLISTYGEDYYREPVYNDEKFDYKIVYDKIGLECKFKNDIIVELAITNK